ncbi:hypothetical protein C8F04DRAFT_1401655 [Mycena alexandri]|uniref:F-box domain-containing protein n=1 Tax=Mycena alexandri TaxID=1745969 RepID=A0AAD6WSM3_9AGAR|nr:hypothetical protein C8F04DRAFT_1401655 [Mycena alexandri]
MAGFSRLPVELIDAIASSVARKDLLSLCRSNHKVNSVCIRWIYHLVVLESRAPAIACFNTIISNIYPARSVRELILRFHSDLMLKAFARVMRAALEKLTALDALEISTSAELFVLLSGLCFPRLRQCAIPFSVDTMSFLQLHLKLVQLSVDPVPDDSLQFPATFDPVQLPDLQIFRGPESVAHAVIPGSRTSHTIIFWDPRLQTDAATVFEAIGVSGTRLCKVNNVVVAWNPMLVTAAARYIPNVSSLSIRNVSAFQAPAELEAFFSCMDEPMKVLSALTSISVVQEITPGTLEAEDLDWEFQTVRRWGDISPNLQCCILPSETKWMRSPSNVWYPRNHSDNAADMLTRFRWFIETVIGSTALPPAYSAVLEMISGKEMVDALKRAFEQEGAVPELHLAHIPAGISMTFIPSPSTS